ncbi:MULTISPECIES: RidA family protein [Burkholderiaceae]|uniref:RidA family protein n=1 Tax=Burkholderiaceae TaxID=119060 RepID=UPI001422A1CA|nr:MULTISPECIES: RidA family protein [Burkholderiaceae]MBN3846257.1 RidA family protein [Paraburkholderia sp. Ac-20342]NIF55456.1 RidA family protein [Burkholderia sp. Ax-1724]NIF80549.1 RidA family protein [Paraburkholderia sp. Cy-641]
MSNKTAPANGSALDLTSGRRRFLATSAAAATATASGLLATTASAATCPDKQWVNLGVPWEASYGYVQAIRVGDTIYVSGQLSHDDTGKLVAPAPVDANGKVVDFSNMGLQMRQAYANATKVLKLLGFTMANVVEETLLVLDVDTAFAVAGDIRRQAYGSNMPIVTSTMLATPRLAFVGQLIEIKFVARVI